MENNIMFETPKPFLQPMYVSVDMSDRRMEEIFKLVLTNCKAQSVEAPSYAWEQQLALDGTSATKMRLKVLADNIVAYYIFCDAIGQLLGADNLKKDLILGFGHFLQYAKGLEDGVGYKEFELAQKMEGLTNQAKLVLDIITHNGGNGTTIGRQGNRLIIEINL